MPEEAPSDEKPDVPARLFLVVEHGVYAALGALLSVIAVVALADAGMEIIRGVASFSDVERIFPIMDELLFVLMLVEILHTVRVSMRSGALNPEPFLIVGLIASIRRVLVITLESSKATKDVDASTNLEIVFRHSMIELGVLALLISVMVASIIMFRRMLRQDRTSSM